MAALPLPEPALVLMVGPSGSGKSTFARRHFRPTEIVSSDACRAALADDENAQDVSRDAFAMVEFVATRRLARGRFTVIDATNVSPEARRQWLDLARRHQVPIVAIVLALGEDVCLARNAQRTDRNRGDYASRQARQLQETVATLEDEGFAAVYRLGTEAEVSGVQFARLPVAPAKKA